MWLPYCICDKIIPFDISYKFVWDAYTSTNGISIDNVSTSGGQVLTTTKRKVTEATVYLRCALFRDGCKATAKLNKEINLITPINVYNHDLTMYKAETFRLKAKCKAIATFTPLQYLEAISNTIGKMKDYFEDETDNEISEESEIDSVLKIQ